MRFFGREKELSELRKVHDLSLERPVRQGFLRRQADGVTPKCRLNTTHRWFADGKQQSSAIDSMLMSLELSNEQTRSSRTRMISLWMVRPVARRKRFSRSLRDTCNSATSDATGSGLMALRRMYVRACSTSLSGTRNPSEE